MNAILGRLPLRSDRDLDRFDHLVGREDLLLDQSQKQSFEKKQGGLAVRVMHGFGIRV